MRVYFSLASLLSSSKYYSRRNSVTLRSMMAVSSPQTDSDTRLIDSYLRNVYVSAEPKNIFSVYVTGGGAASLQWLFSVPGASSSLMDGGVLYSHASLKSFLRRKDDPPLSCTVETAVEIARSAYIQAAEMYISEYRSFSALKHARIFGVSCTAALVSDRPKKGAHRSHVAAYSQEGVFSLSVDFEKGRRDRRGEDVATSYQVLEAIGRCSGIPSPFTESQFLNSKPLTAAAATTTTTTTTVQTNVNAVGGEREGGKAEEEVVVEELRVTEFNDEDDVIDRICAKKLGHALFVVKGKKTTTYDAIPYTTSSGGSDNNHTEDADKATAATTATTSNTTITTTAEADSNSSRRSRGAVLNDEFVVLEDIKLPEGTLIFSGSFNPLHEGHVDLVVAALKSTLGWNEGQPCPLVVFEIAAVNADKPPLPREEILRRLRQFDSEQNKDLASAGLTNIAISVTSEPLFLEKSKIFQQCTFLIGADTMVRLINPKYYVPKTIKSSSSSRDAGKSSSVDVITNDDGKSSSSNTGLLAMTAALATIAARGCKFVVGGRLQNPSAATANGAGSDGDVKKFETLESVLEESLLELPASIVDMFLGLSPREFRKDLSSSEIRRRSS